MDKNESPKPNKEETIKPDPKTLHTSDPQDEMEGPLSSLVQGVKENLDENSESKEQADEKKEENM